MPRDEIVISVPPRRPEPPKSEKWRILVGIAFSVGGLVALVAGLVRWAQSGFPLVATGVGLGLFAWLANPDRGRF